MYETLAWCLSHKSDHFMMRFVHSRLSIHFHNLITSFKTLVHVRCATRNNVSNSHLVKVVCEVTSSCGEHKKEYRNPWKAHSLWSPVFPDFFLVYPLWITRAVIRYIIGKWDNHRINARRITHLCALLRTAHNAEAKALISASQIHINIDDLFSPVLA